jgi:predicted metal-dependent HD superfamily phosphohydrolase
MREDRKIVSERESQLVTEASAFVKAYHKDRKPEWLKYHTFEHAMTVARAAMEIGAACNLSADDLEIVILAAWFHDTGYVGTIEGHEEKSKEIAKDFLAKRGYPQDKVDKVLACIGATKMPQNPKTLLEQVLCDADISHLARKNFVESSELVRLEIEHRKGRKLTEIEWLTMNTKFVAGHRYHTEYAKATFAEQLAANLETLRKRLDKAKQGN